MATRSEKPLIVITGPTASGKSGLAVKLAKQFNGEIIAADSRTVYKYMDIGTAKPDEQEQLAVPHWGIDLVEPDQTYSAARFKSYALERIADIRARNKVPFLVGGTGLYVDGVIFDYQFGGPVDSELRQRLNNMSKDSLYNYCVDNNITLPVNQQNKRHLIRVIEQKSINTMRSEVPINNTIVVAITTDKYTLYHRIEQRIEQMLQSGVVEEASMLGKKYGWDHESMTGNIYRLAKLLKTGELTEADFITECAAADRRLVKRQLTWMRRNPYITWGTLQDSEQFISNQLNT